MTSKPVQPVTVVEHFGVSPLFVVAAFVIGALIVAGGIYALGKVVDNQDNGNAGDE